MKKKLIPHETMLNINSDYFKFQTPPGDRAYSCWAWKRAKMLKSITLEFDFFKIALEWLQHKVPLSDCREFSALFFKHANDDLRWHKNSRVGKK
jgi:hypothetical protein